MLLLAQEIEADKEREREREKEKEKVQKPEESGTNGKTGESAPNAGDVSEDRKENLGAWVGFEDV